MSEIKKIDILIICYERTPLLEQCIESIDKFTPGIDYKVHVVEGRRSAAENRNIALSMVRSPWFVMMDDDVTVSDGWLEKLLKYAGNGIGQIQSKLLFSNGRIFSAEKIFIAPWGENKVIGMGEKDNGRFDYVRTAELLSGTCNLYNSKILDACSFDTNYKGAQWEDCDFSMQIKMSGFHLLYCGESAVYHHNLYRNALTENYNYFKEKWFGRRELTGRGVLYVGLACDIDCAFCYYKHAAERKFHPLKDLKNKCSRFKKFYGNTHVDITGGEPTIYPYIIPLVEHCRIMDLKPTIITHGQRLTPQLVKNLKDAGIEDFLISCHGMEKEHDYVVNKPGGYKAMRAGIKNVLDAGLTFRTNTVVTKVNYKTLPGLANEFAEMKPKVVNLIMFNPFQEWINLPLQEFQMQYSEAAPYIMEAVSILSSAGIEVNVRYMPFCLFEGFEKHVMNFPQLPFDRWEWDFKPCHRLDGEYDYLFYAMKENAIRYEQPPPCRKCSLLLICSGLPRQYSNAFGYNELKPRGGRPVRDPLYFKGLKSIAASANNAVPYALSPEDFIKTYPELKNSDPLIYYQTLPFEKINKFLLAKHLFLRKALLRLKKTAKALIQK
ncbi:MAG: radical SAM protein [Nitrospirae bacterium]|nr:radical SAM protein [Nitrospirota bacterium]